MIQPMFDCLGIPIHGVPFSAVRDFIEQRQQRNEQTWIVTANPEILLHAERYPSYRDVLLCADVRMVDGFGLFLAGRLTRSRPARVTGVDLAMDLASWCASQQAMIGLIGGEDGVADQAGAYLKNRFPGLSVVTRSGGRIDAEGDWDEEAQMQARQIAVTGARVVLVAFGHPKQDYWILRARDIFPKGTVFVGVGGTFDYWAGVKKRAPRWVQRIGLEWFWRVLREPRRIRRILDAVFVFPYAVIKSFRNNGAGD